MTKRKPLPAPPQAPLAAITSDELIEHILNTVKTSRQFGIEPVCAITVVEPDDLYCGSVLCVYTSLAGVDKDAKPIIELQPQFYPQEVADKLQIRGLLTESQTTRRTGISTTWCYFSEVLA